MTNAEKNQTKHCNCRKKQECPLEGKCRSEGIICKCAVAATGQTRKVYLDTAEGNFKQGYYNHKKSFRNRKYVNETSLSKYIWEMKDISPNLMWFIVKSVPDYSNISRRCMLCLHEKYEILNYPDQVEFLNKRSELVSKCRHVNKFFLSNYKSND